MTERTVGPLTPEQARRLAAYAERPRVGDWSLRSALVRFAQPEPVAASAVLELVRRLDSTLAPYARRLEQLPAEQIDAEPGQPSATELLTVAATLDELGDVLTCWADDRLLPRPDDEVRRLAEEAFTLLGGLGVPRESRRPGR